MVVRKKVRPSKASAPANRVKKITSRDQFESILEKTGNRLLIVQFYQASAWTCKQLRPYYIKFSSTYQFRKMLFAEVDADEAPDVVKAAGVSRIPTYNVYFDGELVDSYTGGVPNQLQQIIKENISKYNTSGGPLSIALKILAATSIIATASYLASKSLRSNSNSAASDEAKLKEDLLETKRRIVEARNRLRALENAHRVKPARVQRKIVEQLEAKRRMLERGRQQGELGLENNADGASEGSGKGSGSKRHGGDKDDVDEFWPLPPPGIKARRRALPVDHVLYSDEEEELATGPSAAASGSGRRGKGASNGVAAEQGRSRSPSSSRRREASSERGRKERTEGGRGRESETVA